MVFLEKEHEATNDADSRFKEELQFLYDNSDYYIKGLIKKGLDIGLAEDIFHEAFIRLIKIYLNGKEFDAKTGAKGYFKKILENLTIDHFRRRKAQSSEGLEQISCTDSPERNLRVIRLGLKLIEAMNKLNGVHQREVVEHRLVEELSSRDTALALNLSEEQVDIVLFRARTKLKQLLGDETL